VRPVPGRQSRGPPGRNLNRQGRGKSAAPFAGSRSGSAKPWKRGSTCPDGLVHSTIGPLSRYFIVPICLRDEATLAIEEFNQFLRMVVANDVGHNIMEGNLKR